jgi:hypothetical protein
MRKNSKHVRPALKHGIYSGIGLLPTESRAKFRKFRRQIFAELNLLGRLEQDIGEQIVRLEWRRQNFSTYDLAERAQARCRAIPSSLSRMVSRFSRLEFFYLPVGAQPAVLREWDFPDLAHTRAEVLDSALQGPTRSELGAALELVELGDVATLGHLAMIARLYKKLAYVRAIKSMAPAALPAPSQPLLEKAA